MARGKTPSFMPSTNSARKDRPRAAVAPVVGRAGALDPVLKGMGEIAERRALSHAVEAGEILEPIEQRARDFIAAAVAVLRFRAKAQIFFQKLFPALGVFAPRGFG